jgi:spore coat protein CotH
MKFGTLAAPVALLVALSLSATACTPPELEPDEEEGPELDAAAPAPGGGRPVSVRPNPPVTGDVDAALPAGSGSGGVGGTGMNPGPPAGTAGAAGAGAPRLDAGVADRAASASADMPGRAPDAASAPRDAAKPPDLAITPDVATAPPDVAVAPADAAPSPADAAGGDAKPLAAYGTIFDLTVLHRVDIKVDTMYLAQLENDTTKRVPCTFTFDGMVLPNTGIRKKGGIGSVRSINDKTGWSVDFHEFTKSQRLLGLKKLTLNNAVQDPSFLSEHIGYELSRRAGIPAAFTAHGLVTFNGTPFGIYVLKESVDGEFLDRNFGEAFDQGNLYEGACCDDFTPDPSRIELKDEVSEMRSRQDIKDLAALVATTPDATFATAVGAKLDLDNFIAGFALDALTDHWDGYSFKPNNYYMYNHPGTGRFVFLPHGMDQLFQSDSDPLRGPNGNLAKRVRAIPALDTRFRDRLKVTLSDAIWDMKALYDRIDRVATTLRSFTPSDQRTMNDYGSFNGNVQKMKDALARRKPAAPRPGDGTGLRGEYFTGRDFVNLVLSRTDDTIGFGWGDGSPAPSVPNDNFSVRWAGFVQPEYTELYTFTTVSDDGVRLWVDGKLVVDNWTDHAPTENSGTVALTAQQKYTIRMEYYEAGGGAEARLLWSSPSRLREIVPRYRLFPQ